MTNTIERNCNDWATTQELRALIKKNLGFNAKQVSCSKGHSNQYLTITVRDPKIDISKVYEFAKSFNTWSMDNTDYVQGQSVNVATTREVDDIHCIPNLEELKACIPLAVMGSGVPMKNGLTLWLDDRGYYIGKDQKRTHYVSTWDVQNGTEWAIKSLALNMARISLQS